MTFDAEAKKLFDKELKGVDQKQLVTSIEKAARVAIGKESKVLRRAITQALDGALPGQLEVKGTPRRRHVPQHRLSRAMSCAWRPNSAAV